MSGGLGDLNDLGEVCCTILRCDDCALLTYTFHAATIKNRKNKLCSMLLHAFKAKPDMVMPS